MTQPATTPPTPGNLTTELVAAPETPAVAETPAESPPPTPAPPPAPPLSEEQRMRLMGLGRLHLGDNLVRLIGGAPMNLTLRAMISSKVRLIIPDSINTAEDICLYVGQNFKPLNDNVGGLPFQTRGERPETGHCRYHVTQYARFVGSITPQEIWDANSSSEDWSEVWEGIQNMIREKAAECEHDLNWTDEGDYDYEDHEPSDDQEGASFSIQNVNELERSAIRVIREHYPDWAEELHL